jgi:hypothetical protein
MVYQNKHTLLMGTAIISGILITLWGWNLSNAPTESTEDNIEIITEVEESSESTTEEATDPIVSEIIQLDLEQEGSRSVPFGNGKGLGVVNDAVLGIYTDSGSSYATRFTAEGETTVELMATGQSNASSLSTLGDDALALTYGGSGLTAFFSSDGGLSWTDGENVGSRSQGATVPTSCLWEEDGNLKAMIAWVDPPQLGDGGPLYIRTWDGGSWSEITRVGDQKLASSPTLACDEFARRMVYREGPTGGIDVWFTIETDGTFSEPVEIFSGADPHMAMCNDVIWVGYHHVGTSLAKSTDGGETWETEQLDQTGKFGSIACSSDTVVASWGHFPTLQAANNAIGSDNQRSAYAKVSFDGGETWTSWKPAGEDVDQNVSTVAAAEGVAYILWETSGAVRFASISQK